MADPVDFITAGGDILAGVGGLLQGFEMQDAYDYNASILSDQEAQVMAAANLDIRKIGLEEDQMLGTQQAMYAKAGVTMSGSPLDTALNTASNFEFDKSVAKYNTQIAVNRLGSESAMQKYYGKEAANKGMFDLGTKLLSGAGALL